MTNINLIRFDDRKFRLEYAKWLKCVNVFLDIKKEKFLNFPILSNSATWYSIEKNIYLYSELEQLKN